MRRSQRITDMKPEGTDRSTIAAGALFLAIGALFGWQSLGLEMGTALRMGPGFFPLILAGVLMLLGLLVVLSGLKGAGDAWGPMAWAGMAFILPAPVIFGLTVRGLGFVPAIFLVTLVAGFAARRLAIWQVLLLAVAVTVFATLVFSYGLALPYRRFGPWLEF